jgi:hypothetical protein
MILNVGEAISRISRMLKETIPGVQLIHVDASEQHKAVDKESQPFADLMNNMRFLVQDMVLGDINETHPLYHYLHEYGATTERLKWFVEQPAVIDVIGLDYYSHSELEWGKRGRVFPGLTPEGFVSVAKDYVNHFKLPIMLSETNIRGFVEDRISWLKYMVEQCEILEDWLVPQDIPFKGFCWYPFIDSTDWCSLVTKANCNIDPQGIFWLDCRSKKRNPSELSEIYKALALGQITSKDIPAYLFREPLDKQLVNFLPMMDHWQWREPLKPSRSISKPASKTTRKKVATF